MQLLSDGAWAALRPACPGKRALPGRAAQAGSRAWVVWPYLAFPGISFGRLHAPSVASPKGLSPGTVGGGPGPEEALAEYSSALAAKPEERLYSNRAACHIALGKVRGLRSGLSALQMPATSTPHPFQAAAVRGWVALVGLLWLLCWFRHLVTFWWSDA